MCVQNPAKIKQIAQRLFVTSHDPQFHPELLRGFKNPISGKNCSCNSKSKHHTEFEIKQIGF
jgi:hypothetical protein